MGRSIISKFFFFFFIFFDFVYTFLARLIQDGFVASGTNVRAVCGDEQSAVCILILFLFFLLFLLNKCRSC